MTAAAVTDLKLLRDGADRCERCPIDYAMRRLTGPQLAFLSLTARIALWRGGNQLGKSWGLAVDLVAFCRGQHPWQKQEPRHRPPVRVMVVSYSWAQMDPLIEKIWQLLPKGEIDPALDYRPGQGLIGRKEKKIEFVSGPGKGSLIVLATYKQGAERIAGGTFHRIYTDEPMPEEIYGELRPRLNRYRGHMRIAFTPTLKSTESAPVDYLRKKLEAGPAEEFTELHTVLSEENVTIRGGLVPQVLLPQSEIDAFERDSLAVERGMRMRGDWEPITVDRWLQAFGDHNITTERPPAGADLIGTFDWGLRGGNQYTALLAIRQTGTLIPEVWVWDEVAPEEPTTMEVDAEAVKAMLDRHRLLYQNIDLWVGDTPTGKNRRGRAKQNADMRKHLWHVFRQEKLPDGRALGLSDTQYIQLPLNKGAASEQRGLRLMESVMSKQTRDGRPCWRVHPRCKKFIKSVLNYNGGKWSPHKHAIDAVRYGFERGITVGSWVNARAIYS